MARFSRNGDNQRPEKLTLNTLRIWCGSHSECYEPDQVRPGNVAADAIAEAMRARKPVWLDINFDTDVEMWMQPWDRWEKKRTDWSALRDVAAVLDLDLPAEVTDLSGLPSGVAHVFARLQFVNEFGVLRSMTPAWFGDAAPTMVAPLAGFIPSAELEPLQGASTNETEVVALRVNMAVSDNLLVTIRLTDRLLSGTGPDSPGRRIRADEYYERPKLEAFPRFLPSNRAPTAQDLGEALAIYLAATCGSVSEYARQRLRAVLRDLVAKGHQASALVAGSTEIEELERYDEIFEIGAALENVEEEMLRLVQRLSDVDSADRMLVRVRAQYEEGLKELRSVEAEVRWAVDVAANHRARRAEERQKTLERIAAVLGTLLIIAALVPSLFGEDAKLPKPKESWWDFIGMLCIMFSAALGVLPVLVMRLVGPSSRRVLKMSWAAAVVFLVAGVVELRWL